MLADIFDNLFDTLSGKRLERVLAHVESRWQSDYKYENDRTQGAGLYNL